MAVSITAMGDAAFLTQILNGVAMIFATDDIKDLIKMGFMLGLLLVGLRGIMKASMEMQHLLLAFIIYGGLFAPKVDQVEIYDPYTGISYTVDNVPLGVAYGGKILSTVGVGLTELMEQAFQAIDPTAGSYKGVMDEGFLDPLRILINMRYVPYNPADPLGQALHYNIQNHVMSCTALFIQSGRIDETRIGVAANFWEAIRVRSPVLTQLYKTPATGTITEETCQYAADQMDAVISPTNAAYQQLLAESINAHLRLPKDASGNPPPDPANVLKTYAEGIIGVAGDAFNHVNNQIMAHAALGGLQKFGAQRQDLAYSLAVQTSKQRRDFTHAAEGSMFMNVMRPMMSFLEAVVYALSPLVAFLVVMGPQGISIGVKYLLLVAWMQLWLPVLSVVKLYVYMTAHSELSGLMTAYGNIESLEAAWMFQDKLSSYLGIAGLLVGMVPVIALMLISGGAVTANAIASRLTSTASSSASTAAGTLAPNPISSSAGHYKIGGAEGLSDIRNGGGVMMGSGALQGMTKLNFSSGTEQAMTAQAQQAQSSAIEQMASGTRAMTQTEGFKQLAQAGTSNTSTLGSAWQQAYSASLQKVKDARASSGADMSDEAMGAVAAAMTGSFHAGTPKGWMAGAGVEGSLRGLQQSGDKYSENIGHMLSSSAGSKFSNDLAASIRNDTNYAQTMSRTATAEDGIAKSLASTRTDMARAQSSYMQSMAQSDSLRTALGMSGSIDSTRLQNAARSYYGDSASGDRYQDGERFAAEYTSAANSGNFDKVAAMTGHITGDARSGIDHMRQLDSGTRAVGAPDAGRALDRGQVDGRVANDQAFEKRAGAEMAAGAGKVESQRPNEAAVTAANQRHQGTFRQKNAEIEGAYNRTSQRLQQESEATMTAAGANEIGRLATWADGLKDKWGIGAQTPGSVMNEATERAERVTEGSAMIATVRAMAGGGVGNGVAAAEHTRSGGRWSFGGADPDPSKIQLDKSVMASGDGDARRDIKQALGTAQFEQARGHAQAVEHAEYARRAALVQGDQKGVQAAESTIRRELVAAAGGDERAGAQAYNSFMATQNELRSEVEGKVGAQMLKNGVSTGTISTIGTDKDVARGAKDDAVPISMARDFISGKRGDAPEVVDGATNAQVAAQFERDAYQSSNAILLGGKQPADVGQIRQPDFGTTPTEGMGNAMFNGTPNARGGGSRPLPDAAPAAVPPPPRDRAGAATPAYAGGGPGQGPGGSASGAGRGEGDTPRGATSSPAADATSTGGQSGRDAAVPGAARGRAYTPDARGDGARPSSGGPGFGVGNAEGHMPDPEVPALHMSGAADKLVTVPQTITPDKELQAPTARAEDAGFTKRSDTVEPGDAPEGSPQMRQFADTMRQLSGGAATGMYSQSAGQNATVESAAGMEMADASAAAVGRGGQSENLLPQEAAASGAPPPDSLSDPSLAAQADATAARRKEGADGALARPAPAGAISGVAADARWSPADFTGSAEASASDAAATGAGGQEPASQVGGPSQALGSPAVASVAGRGPAEVDRPSPAAAAAEATGPMATANGSEASASSVVATGAGGQELASQVGGPSQALGSPAVASVSGRGPAEVDRPSPAAAAAEAAGPVATASGAASAKAPAASASAVDSQSAPVGVGVPPAAERAPPASTAGEGDRAAAPRAPQDPTALPKTDFTESRERDTAMEAIRQAEANTGRPILSSVSPEEARSMTMDRAREIVAEQAPGYDFDRAENYARQSMFAEEMRRHSS